jgi:hypothetical protein
MSKEIWLNDHTRKKQFIQIHINDLIQIKQYAFRNYWNALCNFR